MVSSKKITKLSLVYTKKYTKNSLVSTKKITKLSLVYTKKYTKNSLVPTKMFTRKNPATNWLCSSWKGRISGEEDSWRGFSAQLLPQNLKSFYIYIYCSVQYTYILSSLTGGRATFFIFNVEAPWKCSRDSVAPGSNPVSFTIPEGLCKICKLKISFSNFSYT